MNTDGNLAALDAYQKQIDADYYVDEWKENWISEQVENVIASLREKGEADFDCGIWTLAMFITDYLTECDNKETIEFLTGSKSEFWDYVIKDVTASIDADAAFDDAHQEQGEW